VVPSTSEAFTSVFGWSKDRAAARFPCIAASAKRVSLAVAKGRLKAE
jgi:hypothetical protein